MRRYARGIAAGAVAAILAIALMRHFLWLPNLLLVGFAAVLLWLLFTSRTFRTIFRNLRGFGHKLLEEQETVQAKSVRLADEALKGGPEIAVEYSATPSEILGTKDVHAAYKAFHEKRLTLTNDGDARAYDVQVADIVHGKMRAKFKRLSSLRPHSEPVQIEHEIDGSRSGDRNLVRFFWGEHPYSEGPPIPPFEVIVSYQDGDHNWFETHGCIIFDRVAQAAHYDYKGRVLVGQRTKQAEFSNQQRFVG